MSYSIDSTIDSKNGHEKVLEFIDVRAFQHRLRRAVLGGGDQGQLDPRTRSVPSRGHSSAPYCSKARLGNVLPARKTERLRHLLGCCRWVAEGRAFIPIHNRPGAVDQGGAGARISLAW